MPPNWSALYERGRCKFIGVPWNNEELNAIYALKIPYEYVRLGHLTVVSYQEALNATDEVVKATGKRPIDVMKKADLQAEARELGLNFTDEATRLDLIQLIKQALIAKQEQAPALES